MNPKLPKKLEKILLSTLTDYDEYAEGKIASTDLYDAFAKNVIIEESLLQRVSLTGAKLPKLRLRDVRLEGCDISVAFLENCRMRRVEFISCRLLGVQMLSAEMDDVLFKECNLEGAVFASTKAKHLHFQKCILSNATFEGADLENVTFDRCDLSQSDFRNVKFQDADLRGSILNGMQIDAKAVKGIVISSEQAIQMVSLLGVVVEDEEEY
ncbi:MAG: pentapeptide repeat-containing protein [Anaerolineae bacterium]|jgi:uncharacterized protein YjbI with pentapeptide repeats|nr:pentapeptide repeat-containing protein [Anaerolineae bacterium]MBT7191676.1 pentapeptide repeat-containing protein [Anaerolineae bacterium]MBT7991768.1 pentapeptide repeat-containing protein [Anaerolineae bacterium]